MNYFSSEEEAKIKEERSKIQGPRSFEMSDKVKKDRQKERTRMIASMSAKLNESDGSTNKKDLFFIFFTWK